MSAPAPAGNGADLALVFWPQTALLVPGVNPEPSAAIEAVRESSRRALDDALAAVGPGAQLIVVAPRDTGPPGEREPDAMRETGWGTLAGAGIALSVALAGGRLSRADGASPPPEAPAPFPVAAAVALLLLDEFGHRSGISVLDVGPDDGSAGPDFGFAGPSVLIVLGDGSARSTTASPGRFDPAAEGFDDALASALETGDAGWFLSRDPAETQGLQVSGRRAWALAAGLLGGRGERDPARPASSGLYGRWRPFGVEYLVALWLVTRPVTRGAQSLLTNPSPTIQS